MPKRTRQPKIQNSTRELRTVARGGQDPDDTCSVLFGALEVRFQCFMSRFIPRVWRDAAIRSFLNTVRTEFTVRPELTNPESPRKRQRIKDSRADQPGNSRTGARSCLLAYSKLVYKRIGDSRAFVVELRDLIMDDEDVLDADFNLNVENLSWDKLIASLERQEDIEYNAGSQIYCEVDEELEETEDIDDLKKHLALTRSKGGTHTFWIQEAEDSDEDDETEEHT
ncbi:hypothetical protein E8E13_000082 [Curvularia kusanoi]|uniref:Uncharacterized protein n=1 Tax=Curvularia kusanoi TaxID=90978 RepID=A0A9P4W953_CURKU|nr:hypothetical protein E8E13_000082 [Curvularia kusanoi]